jgi:hypothetical protein
VRRYLRAFLLLTAVLLAYTQVERYLRARPDAAPAVLDHAGVVLAVASLPWSLFALGFFRAAASPLGQMARDLVYLLILTGGTALNLVLLTAGLRWIMRRWRGD